MQDLFCYLLADSVDCVRIRHDFSGTESPGIRNTDQIANCIESRLASRNIHPALPGTTDCLIEQQIVFVILGALAYRFGA